MFFFCFKQKTAYEMRISDWSSDVCSSDLEILELSRARFFIETLDVALLGLGERRIDEDFDELALGQHAAHHFALDAEGRDEGGYDDQAGVAHQLGDLADAADILDPVSLCEAEVAVEPVTDIVAVEQEAVPVHRSEEHPSELLSLMRISYAVFCL